MLAFEDYFKVKCVAPKIFWAAEAEKLISPPVQPMTTIRQSARANLCPISCASTPRRAACSRTSRSWTLSQCSHSQTRWCNTIQFRDTLFESRAHPNGASPAPFGVPRPATPSVHHAACPGARVLHRKRRTKHKPNCVAVMRCNNPLRFARINLCASLHIALCLSRPAQTLHGYHKSLPLRRRGMIDGLSSWMSIPLL